MVERFDSLITHVGPEAYLFLALASMLEYVVPPFPGDTIIVLGGVYAIRGEKPWALVFLAITLGSVLGGAADYGIGWWIGRRLERRPDWRPLFGFSRERLLSLEEKMRRRGTVLLLVNRFLPAMRAMLFFAAGASRVPFAKVLVLGAISAMAWNVLLMGAGLAVGGNAERLERFLRTYQEVALGVLGLVAVLLLVRYAYRRRRAGQGERT